MANAMKVFCYSEGGEQLMEQIYTGPGIWHYGPVVIRAASETPPTVGMEFESHMGHGVHYKFRVIDEDGRIALAQVIGRRIDH